MRSYFADAAVLARKDLRLELRARDTVPAMLLFVIAILVVFHFALPSGSSRLAELGLLWVAILFTALLGLGRAFVAEREQGLLDGLVLAPVDRSAIWLAKGIATLAFLVLAEVVALPAFAYLGCSHKFEFCSHWCERGDSNPHGLPRQLLRLVRLPIPPLSRMRRGTLASWPDGNSEAPHDAWCACGASRPQDAAGTSCRIG